MRTHAEGAGFPVRKIDSHQRRFFRDRFFHSKAAFNISEWPVWLRACHTPFRSGFRTLPAYVTGGERHRSLPRAA